MRTTLGSPSLDSTGDSGLARGTGRSTTSTVAESVTLTPTLYPLLSLSMRTSGALNS